MNVLDRRRDFFFVDVFSANLGRLRNDGRFTALSVDGNAALANLRRRVLEVFRFLVDLRFTGLSVDRDAAFTSSALRFELIRFPVDFFTRAILFSNTNKLIDRNIGFYSDHGTVYT
jgi:hypothetical protein